jgi:hypothetical protein
MQMNILFGPQDAQECIFPKKKLVGGESLHISCHSFELEIWNLIKLCSAIEASTAKGTLHTL